MAISCNLPLVCPALPVTCEWRLSPIICFTRSGPVRVSCVFCSAYNERERGEKRENQSERKQLKSQEMPHNDDATPAAKQGRTPRRADACCHFQFHSGVVDFQTDTNILPALLPRFKIGLCRFRFQKNRNSDSLTGFGLF